MRVAAVVSCIVFMCLLSGCSDSDSDSGTNPGSAPGIPTGLTVTDAGLMSLTLSWDTVDDATEYVLYRSDSETGTYTQVYTGAAAGYLDDNLIYARTYWYQVCAENSHGESDASTPVSGTTDTPAGFVVTGSPSGSVDFTYNYYSELNGHPWYRSDPIGINIIFPAAGDHAGQWVFNDQIEGIDLYYSVSGSDYPPPTGWYTAVGDTRTYILLTPF